MEALIRDGLFVAFGAMVFASPHPHTLFEWYVAVTGFICTRMCARFVSEAQQSQS